MLQKRTANVRGFIPAEVCYSRFSFGDRTKLHLVFCNFTNTGFIASGKAVEILPFPGKSGKVENMLKSSAKVRDFFLSFSLLVYVCCATFSVCPENVLKDVTANRIEI